MTSDRDDELARYREYHERTVALLNRQAAELGAARARIAELEGELAAAESTIAALEDPELRAALATPTTGD